ncbi:MAG: molybdopterin-dependent oxidoreductase [Desulfitobacteriaceae bacterium]
MKGAVGGTALVTLPSFAETVFKKSALADEAAQDQPDLVEYTTCCSCLGRCALEVHKTADGKPRFVTGARGAIVNDGGVCPKGAAGIMHYFSPARLRHPLIRVKDSARGEGKFKRLTWDELYKLLNDGNPDYGFLGLKKIRETAPWKLSFYGGRDQMPMLNGFFAAMFGTTNYAGHGGFCAVNVLAGGTYTVGGSFWEFGAQDPQYAKYHMVIGLAEDHFPNMYKKELNIIRENQGKVVYVGPHKMGLGAVADEWIPIKVGTDGAFFLGLCKVLFDRKLYDEEYLRYYTNAAQLVIKSKNPDGTPKQNHGLLLRVKNPKTGQWVEAVLDKKTGQPQAFDFPGVEPDLYFSGQVSVPDSPKDGSPIATYEVATAFNLYTEVLKDYTPDKAEKICGITAGDIQRIALEMADVAFNQAIALPIPWTDYLGREHKVTIGRPVSFYAMRGIAVHSNGFQTTRALHVLQMLLGAIDNPGSWKYKSPYPKPIPAGGSVPVPGSNHSDGSIGGFAVQESIDNDGNVETQWNHVRYPATNLLVQPFSPSDLAVDENGRPLLLDHAYSWEFPFAAHRVISAIPATSYKEDPHRAECHIWYMAQLQWNNAYNLYENMKFITEKHSDGRYKIPFIIQVDAFYSDSATYSDLVIPDTTFFERYDAMGLLDRPISQVSGPADCMRHPILPVLFDSRPWGDVLVTLGAKLGLPGFINPDGSQEFKDYGDFIVRWEFKPGVGVLAGGRGDGTQVCNASPNPDQLKLYFQDKVQPVAVTNGDVEGDKGKEHIGNAWWYMELPDSIKHYRNVNKDYLKWAKSMKFIDSDRPIILHFYSEVIQKFNLAGYGIWQGKHRVTGKQNLPPNDPGLIKRLRELYQPLPFWYPPMEWAQDGADPEKYPIAVVTQRPMWQYHSWQHHNPWTRSLLPRNYAYLNPDTAKKYGVKDLDWIEIESRSPDPQGKPSRMRVQIKCLEGTRPDTLWTWIAAQVRPGAWGLDPDAPEVRKSFFWNWLYSYYLPKSWGENLLNFDPFSGMTAWNDLRVRIVGKVDTSETYPIPTAAGSLQPKTPQVLAYNAYKGLKDSGLHYVETEKQ